MDKVVRVLDEYLQTIALVDAGFPVASFVDLAGCLPAVARNQHDGLYHAIDTYLKEHPELSKADKKRLCRLIDCRKLSPDVRAQAIANDRMPLRTIVQLLFVEQERTVIGTTAGTSSSHAPPPDRASVSRVTAIDDDDDREEEHKSDVHRPRGDRAERLQRAAMTRSLSASTKTEATDHRGSRLRNK